MGLKFDWISISRPTLAQNGAKYFYLRVSNFNKSLFLRELPFNGRWAVL